MWAMAVHVLSRGKTPRGDGMLKKLLESVLDDMKVID